MMHRVAGSLQSSFLGSFAKKVLVLVSYTVVGVGVCGLTYQWTLLGLQPEEVAHSPSSSPPLDQQQLHHVKADNSSEQHLNTSTPLPPVPHGVQTPNQPPLPLAYSYQKQTGRRFSVDQALLRSMGLPPAHFFKLSHATKNNVVFVTANSWTHYIESLDTVASVQKHFPLARILYYDWGLAPWQIQRLRTMCNVEYRPFDISRFNIPNLNETRVKFQILKPLLIATVLNEFPGIIYMDSSVRFLDGNLNNIQHVAIQNGGIVMLTGSPDSVWSVTDTGIYDFLPSDIEMLKKVHCLQSGAVLIYNTQRVFNNILWWWYLCALQMECVAPVDNLSCIEVEDRMTDYRKCHRYDQSALNILTANLYHFDALKYHFPQHILPQLLNIWRHPTRMFNLTYCDGKKP